jgi:hypothetical protein
MEKVLNYLNYKSLKVECKSIGFQKYKENIEKREYILFRDVEHAGTSFAYGID